MTHNADNFGVHQFLGNLRRPFAVGIASSSVSSSNFFLAVDHDAFGVGFFNGQFGAIFVVLPRWAIWPDVGPT